MSSSKTRLGPSLFATGAGLVTNLVLATVKLMAGLLGHSSALVADATESFADIAGSMIVWQGIVVANRPADADHPYGHGKAETLAAGGVAVMLFCAAILIVVNAAMGIARPHRSPASFTLYVLLGVIVIKVILARFVNRVGKEVESSAVAADAWHHLSDATTSAAAAVGISIALVGGPGYEMADDWAAIFGALIITINGVRLLRPVIHELMDADPESGINRVAKEIALGIPGVRGVEKCLGRKMGYHYVLDMHVEVDGDMSVANAHEVAHRVKDAIRTQFPRVSEVTIHIEPHPTL
jgi:cation diffusion facilitator family transporter